MKRSMLMFFLLLFFISGCSSDKVGDTERELIYQYLDHNVLTPGFGGQIFSSFRVLKIDKENIYLWALLQEYYNGKMGTGMSGPISLSIKETNGEIEILTHEVPGDGLYYSEDVERIFPKAIHRKIYNFSSNINTIKQMEEECRNRWQQSNGSN